MSSGEGRPDDLDAVGRHRANHPSDIRFDGRRHGQRIGNVTDLQMKPFDTARYRKLEKLGLGAVNPEGVGDVSRKPDESTGRHDLFVVAYHYGQFAVDVLWTLNSYEIHQRLVRDSGWTTDRFETWLAGTIRTALLAAP